MRIYDIVKKLTESVQHLNVGDDVIITGPVQFKGSTGVIDSFGKDNRFVVVNLYNHGKHSFNSSDVSFNEYADSDEEAAELNRYGERDHGLYGDDDRDEDLREYDEDDDYEDEDQGFFVAISSEEDGVFIGMVVKEDGKWRERRYKGNPPHNWGGTYMSYLTPQDVMTWINKDYSGSYDVEGPMDEDEANEYLDMMSESQGDPHKIILNKLRDIERKPSAHSAEDDAKRAEQAKADYAKYVAKMKKKNPNFVPLYKMDEGKNKK